MKFSVCMMSDIDDVGFFRFAEKLGYHAVWVTESQLLFSDPYVVLAQAAGLTRTLRLGTGVAVCTTRLPPVHVSGIATVNRLAPGRTFLGVGTGNTAMRTMGQKPMRIRDYGEYLRVLRALLRGETVDYAYPGGAERPIRICMHDEGYMDLEPPIPLYVSGFGPRAMGLAGAHGDGLVCAIPPRGMPVPDALAHVRKGAQAAGRRLDDAFHNCALVNIAMLEPGEPPNSERVIAQVGPNVMATVYYFYNEIQEKGGEPPPWLEPVWKGYCELIADTPPALRHLRTQEYHYTRLHPGEAALITPELIRQTCLVGRPEELAEQLRELERQGLRELMWATGTEHKWSFAEAFMRQVVRRL